MRYPGVRPLSASDLTWVRNFVVERWGAPTVVAHGTVYYPQDLAGFVAAQDETPLGLVTYQIDSGACEIVTIDSLMPGQGIGTRLLDSVADAARRMGCRRLWLITTNDNLNALRFYQKRGFRLVAIFPDAVTRSRERKPEIPALGDYGIPIRDEIELERMLSTDEVEEPSAAPRA